MARIRTLKPEIWTDPDFVECSPNARLLFVAGLNFASDYGVLPDKPKQLKMQCFPGDGFEVEPLVDELVAAGFWQRRTAPDGANVLVVRTFARHQKVDKPTAGRWGNPADWTHEFEDSSATPPGVLADHSDTEWKGMEGKRKSSSSENNSTSEAVDNPTDDDVYQQVLGLIVDAKEREWAGRIDARKLRGWRHRVHMNTHLEDGDQIRSELALGNSPEQVALTVLGYGHDATRERMEATWCGSDCVHGCEGDGWTRTDEGFAPCPGRTK